MLGVLCLVMIVQLANLQWRNAAFEQRLLTNLETSHERYRLTFRYLSLLQDFETGQRGFVVTGKPEFLEPLEAARREMPEIAGRLESSYPAGTRQTALVKDLIRIGNSKVLYSERVIALRHHDGQPTASAVIAGGGGKRLMDQSRMLAAELERHEKALTRDMLLAAADERSDRLDE